MSWLPLSVKLSFAFLLLGTTPNVKNVKCWKGGFLSEERSYTKLASLWTTKEKFEKVVFKKDKLRHFLKTIQGIWVWRGLVRVVGGGLLWWGDILGGLWNSAMREGFISYFSPVFCWCRGNFGLGERTERWVIIRWGFEIFLIFPNFLNLKSFANSWGNLHIPLSFIYK